MIAGPHLVYFSIPGAWHKSRNSHVAKGLKEGRKEGRKESNEERRKGKSEGEKE